MMTVVRYSNFWTPKLTLEIRNYATLHSDIVKIQASDLVYLGVYDVSPTKDDLNLYQS